MKCTKCSADLIDGDKIKMENGGVCHVTCHLIKDYKGIDLEIIKGLKYAGELEQLDKEWCIVLTTDDDEYTASSYDTLWELKQFLEDFIIDRDSSGWILRGVFHNQKEVKVEFKLDIKIEEDEEDVEEDLTKKQVWEREYKDYVNWEEFEEKYFQCCICGEYDDQQCICYAR